MRFLIGFACVLMLGLAAAGCEGVCSEGNCDCSSDDSCTFECPQGNCNQNCDGDSTCEGSCEGGGCSQSCSGNADCTFTCEGGDCTQSCLTTLGDCSASCVDSSCTSDT